VQISSQFISPLFV